LTVSVTLVGFRQIARTACKGNHTCNHTGYENPSPIKHLLFPLVKAERTPRKYALLSNKKSQAFLHLLAILV